MMLILRVSQPFLITCRARRRRTEGYQEDGGKQLLSIRRMRHEGPINVTGMRVTLIKAYLYVPARSL